MRSTRLATLGMALLNSQTNAISSTATETDQLGFIAIIDEVQTCQNEVFDRYEEIIKGCTTSGNFEACFAQHKEEYDREMDACEADNADL